LINEASDFADIILNLSEESDKLSVAQEDRERTIQQILDIEKQIKDLQTMKDQFINDREQARTDYEAEITKLQEQYHNISDELREKFREKIELSFNNFKTSFDSLTTNYDQQMFKTIAAIHQKMYGLKEHSMTQRSMIMSLYLSYCDANFYNSFRTCEEQNLPYMSDDFEVLIEKLFDLQWETVISNGEIDGTPEKFENSLLIDSASNETYGGKKNVIVETLKKTSQVDINLKYIDTKNSFDEYWRVRLETIQIVLMDANGTLITSEGIYQGEEIQIKIYYPTIFTDKDKNRNPVSFLAQNFACNAYYVTHGQDQEPDWKSECRVDDPFSQDNYKPAEDGDFTIKIMNPETFNIDSLSKIEVHYSGSSIGFFKKEENEEPLIII